MNPMKRLGMAAVLVVGVTLFASTPAWAASGERWGTVELTNIGDEPQASGEATLTNVKLEGATSDWHLFSGKLTVNCQNLTPGAAYWTPAGTFTANRKGEGGINGKVSFEIVMFYDNWCGWVVIFPYVVDVVRINPPYWSGTTVLTGTFVPPWANY